MNIRHNGIIHPASNASADEIELREGYLAYDQETKIIHAVREAPWLRGPVGVAPACESRSGPRVPFNIACPGDAAVTCLACLAILGKREPAVL